MHTLIGDVGVVVTHYRTPSRRRMRSTVGRSPRPVDGHGYGDGQWRPPGFKGGDGLFSFGKARGFIHDDEC